MFWPILQLFLHRQSVKRTAESIVCWTKVKEISTSVLDAKPVTFQKHTKTIIITCLHYLSTRQHEKYHENVSMYSIFHYEFLSPILLKKIAQKWTFG